MMPRQTSTDPAAVMADIARMTGSSLELSSHLFRESHSRGDVSAIREAVEALFDNTMRWLHVQEEVGQRVGGWERIVPMGHHAVMWQDDQDKIHTSEFLVSTFEHHARISSLKVVVRRLIFSSARCAADVTRITKSDPNFMRPSWHVKDLAKGREFWAKTIRSATLSMGPIFIAKGCAVQYDDPKNARLLWTEPIRCLANSRSSVNSEIIYPNIPEQLVPLIG